SRHPCRRSCPAVVSSGPLIVAIRRRPQSMRCWVASAPTAVLSTSTTWISSPVSPGGRTPKTTGSVRASSRYDEEALWCERISAPSTYRERRRSEEHTSELQSRENLVCRLLLEKK